MTDESLTGLLAAELQRPAPAGALALAEIELDLEPPVGFALVLERVEQFPRGPIADLQVRIVRRGMPLIGRIRDAHA